MSVATRSTETSQNHTERIFMLTGFGDNEKQKYISIISLLNASYIHDMENSQGFLTECTHMIAKKPCRSQKFLCACACGKWLLNEKYLIDSHRAKGWLDENDYEWGCKLNFIKSLPKDVQEAPRRWRLRLCKENGNPPFHSWVVGLLVSKFFLVYKRLIEIGGGTAVNLLTTNITSFTHVMSDAGLSDKVRHYHERGIPTVRCEYIAQHLLQDPAPSPLEFSLFPDHSTAESTESKQKPDVVTDQSANVLIHTYPGNDVLTSQQPNPLSQLNREEDKMNDRNVDDAMATSDPQSDGPTPLGQTSAESIGKNSGITVAVVNVASTGHTNDHSASLNSADFHKTNTYSSTVRNPHSTVDVSSKSLTTTSKSCASDVNANLSCASSADEVSLTSSCKALADSEKDTLSDLSMQIEGVYLSDSTTPAKSSSSTQLKVSPQQSSQTKSIPLDGAVKSRDSTPRWVAPDWVTEKRTMIKSALEKVGEEKHLETASMSRKGVQKVSQLKNQSFATRFGKREMTMIESFVDVAHGRSVLTSSRMLLSSTSYPPPDLLYLLMRKYLLDAESQNDAYETCCFLNSLLMLHPPDADHIREDDVYSQALAVTEVTESSLLSVAKLPTKHKVRLWNDMDRGSAEWNFLKSVVKQALRDEDVKRRRNAASLLVVLTTVLESNRMLLRKIFYPKAKKVYLSSAVRMLLKFFRESIEVERKAFKNTDFINDDEDMEVSGEDENEDEESCDEDEYIIEEEESDEFDEGDIYNIAADIYTSMNQIVDMLYLVYSLKKQDKPVGSRNDVIASGLSDVFNDADEEVIERMLYSIPSRLVTSLSRILLERNYRDDFAKVDNEFPLSMKAIVERYLRLIPKVSVGIDEEHKKSKGEISCKGDGTGAGEFSDKENSNKSKAPSSVQRAARFSSANINRRNLKGETPLHKACMQNQPEKVAQLLAISGVDPNARDNAGWTPISEACNHGNWECVRELLKLPLASKDACRDVDATPSHPRLEIDLLACPEEGMTPLHDALDNGHIEVARLLLEKGGVELLYIEDKQGRTPLDVCETEDMKSLVIELACEIGSRVCEKAVEQPTSVEIAQEFDFALKSEDEYKQVLPCASFMTSSDWKKSCQVYRLLVDQLTSSYILESSLSNILQKLVDQEDLDSKETSSLTKCIADEVDSIEAEHVRQGDSSTSKRTSNDVSNEDLFRTEVDIAYVTQWAELKGMFRKHMSYVTGNADYVLKNFDQLNFSVFGDLKKIRKL